MAALNDRRGSFRPVTPQALAADLAELVTASGWRVVGLDADPVLDTAPVRDGVADRLRAAGVPVVLADTGDWWRPASVRLEFGLEPSAALSGWFDDNALGRELIGPLRADRPVLTRFRDRVRDRNFRDRPVAAGPGAVLLLTGPFLQYLFLDLDAVVRFQVAERTLRRLLPPESDWWQQAHRLYGGACPSDGADVIVAYDHPAAPAYRTGRDLR